MLRSSKQRAEHTVDKARVDVDDVGVDPGDDVSWVTAGISIAFALCRRPAHPVPAIIVGGVDRDPELFCNLARVVGSEVGIDSARSHPRSGTSSIQRFF